MEPKQVIEIQCNELVPWDGNFGFGFLHDPFNGVPSFADDTTNQVVVSQYFQCYLTANKTNGM